jgi:hypothetical protein
MDRALEMIKIMGCKLPLDAFQFVGISRQIRIQRNAKAYSSFGLSRAVYIYICIQGGSYLCWPVYGSAHHADRCTTGCEAHTNLADESKCLLADNVRIKYLQFTYHRRCWKMLSLSIVGRSHIRQQTVETNCKNEHTASWIVRLQDVRGLLLF